MDEDKTIIRTFADGIRTTQPGHRRNLVLHAYVKSTSPSVAGMRAIIAAGVPVDAVDRRGNTPFQISVRAGREPIARALLQLGADVYHRNQRGRTALHEAAEAGSLPLVQLCLELLTPDMCNDQDKHGNTPLHLAAASSHGTVVEYLIRVGAHPQIPNHSEKTAFAVAEQSLRRDMSEWWLAASPPPTDEPWHDRRS